MKISEHFGVYGVCIRDNKLLCIKKYGGPYNGRYDLPGGSRKPGESLLDTLHREIMEETSYKISKIHTNYLCDTFVKICDNHYNHHIFGIYEVELKNMDKQKEINTYVTEDELNDSLGEEWVNINQLSYKNSSPLILQVLSKQKKFQAEKYDDWIIL